MEGIDAISETSTLAETIRWTAAVTGMIAAVMVAGRFPGRITGWGFALFVLSSIAWVATGLIDGTWSLAAQNVVMLAVNCVGVWRWLIMAEDGRSSARIARNRSAP